jgi:hypothetical protein
VTGKYSEVREKGQEKGGKRIDLFLETGTGNRDGNRDRFNYSRGNRDRFNYSDRAWS